MLSSYTWGQWVFSDCCDGKVINNTESMISKKWSQTQKREYYLSSNLTELPLYIKLLNRIKKKNMEPSYSTYVNFNIISERDFLINNMPTCVQPIGGNIPKDRSQRKSIQVEYLVRISKLVVDKLLMTYSKNKILRIVEFAAGSGYVGLPLAWIYRDVPNIEVVLVDLKGPSLDIGARRIIEMQTESNVFLHNPNRVRLVQCNIQDYQEIFQVGIALHACGTATDLCIDQCIKHQASFVLCPCCIGKVCHNRSQPLSTQIQNASYCSDTLQGLMFNACLKAGDFGHGREKASTSIPSERRARRKCKALVEYDRLLYAQENGILEGALLQMPPEASSKCDVLLGLGVDVSSSKQEFKFDWSKDFEAISSDVIYSRAEQLEGIED